MAARNNHGEQREIDQSTAEGRAAAQHVQALHDILSIIRPAATDPVMRLKALGGRPDVGGHFDFLRGAIAYPARTLALFDWVSQGSERIWGEPAPDPEEDRAAGRRSLLYAIIHEHQHGVYASLQADGRLVEVTDFLARRLGIGAADLVAARPLGRQGNVPYLTPERPTGEVTESGRALAHSATPLHGSGEAHWNLNESVAIGAEHVEGKVADPKHARFIAAVAEWNSRLFDDPAAVRGRQVSTLARLLIGRELNLATGVRRRLGLARAIINPDKWERQHMPEKLVEAERMLAPYIALSRQAGVVDLARHAFEAACERAPMPSAEQWRLMREIFGAARTGAVERVPELMRRLDVVAPELMRTISSNGATHTTALQAPSAATGEHARTPGGERASAEPGTTSSTADQETSAVSHEPSSLVPEASSNVADTQARRRPSPRRRVRLGPLTSTEDDDRRAVKGSGMQAPSAMGGRDVERSSIVEGVFEVPEDSAVDKTTEDQSERDPDKARHEIINPGLDTFDGW